MDTSKKQRASSPRLRWALLAFPVVVHVLLLGISKESWTLDTGSTDLCILAVVCGYLAVGGLLSYRPRVQARFLLSSYGLILTLLVAELALQFVMPANAHSVPKFPLNRTVHNQVKLTGITGPIHYSVSDLGLRGPKREEFESADVRILCVGGSTTECIAISDRNTWPWRLQEKLNQHLDRQVYVGNAGCSGHFSVHHTHQIQRYGLVDEFDYVLILCGYNDMLCFVRQNYETRLQRVAREALSGEVEGKAYYRYSKLLTLARWFIRCYIRPEGVIQDSRGEFYQVLRDARQTHIHDHGFKRLPEGRGQALDQYADNLRDLIAACRNRKITPVFLTQPCIYRSDLSDEEDSLLWLSSADNGELRELMNQFNEVLTTICKAEDITCLDLAAELPKDTTVFYDDCHFNDSGCEQIADFLAEYFSSTVLKR